MPNAISVHTMSPSPGVTRKLPPSSFEAARTRVTPMSDTAAIDLEEECDQAEDERVEHDRLGEREPKPLDARDLLAHLRLARDRLDHLAEDVAHADARADRPEAGAHAERDGLEAVRRRLLCGCHFGKRSDVHHVEHGRSSLVTLGRSGVRAMRS